MKSEKLNQATIENIKENGHVWNKGEMHRVYLNLSDIIEVEYYNSGNIWSAYLNNGEKISNSKANRLAASKVYLDLDTEELVTDSEVLFNEALEKFTIEDEVENTEEEIEEVEKMEVSLLDEYLKTQNINRNKLAKETDISYTTLQRSSDKNVNNINPRVYYAIAMATGKTTAQVFEEMIDLEMQLNCTIDDYHTFINNIFKENQVHFNISSKENADSIVTSILEIDLIDSEKAVFKIDFNENIDLTINEILDSLSKAMNEFNASSEKDGEYLKTLRQLLISNKKSSLETRVESLAAKIDSMSSDDADDFLDEIIEFKGGRFIDTDEFVSLSGDQLPEYFDESLEFTFQNEDSGEITQNSKLSDLVDSVLGLESIQKTIEESEEE